MGSLVLNKWRKNERQKDSNLYEMLDRLQYPTISYLPFPPYFIYHFHRILSTISTVSILSTISTVSYLPFPPYPIYHFHRILSTISYKLLAAWRPFLRQLFNKSQILKWYLE